MHFQPINIIPPGMNVSNENYSQVKMMMENKYQQIQKDKRHFSANYKSSIYMQRNNRKMKIQTGVLPRQSKSPVNREIPKKQVFTPVSNTFNQIKLLNDESKSNTISNQIIIPPDFLSNQQLVQVPDSVNSKDNQEFNNFNFHNINHDSVQKLDKNIRSHKTSLAKSNKDITMRNKSEV